jgi:DNA-binding PadR family transcriptional regulator
MAIPTLGYALLALLAKRPNTAYELSQRARRPLGYFWTASYGQIHPQLRQLTAAGLLTEEALAGPGPHDKRMYTITAAGRDALAAWVVEPPRQEPSRDELLLKAYAIRAAEPERARELVLAQAATHRRRLAEYTAIRNRLGREAADISHPDFGSLATVRYGIGYERHRAQWCEWLAAQMAGAARGVPR